MIFDEYYTNAYTVKELSLSQAQAILEQSTADSELPESIEQWLNHSYSYRTLLDLAAIRKSFNFLTITAQKRF